MIWYSIISMIQHSHKGMITLLQVLLRRDNSVSAFAAVLPLSNSMRAGMMPDLASMAAQASSMETVPIIITTSRMRSSSAEPGTHTHSKSEKWL